jgi:nucleoside-diphosphate-sugar epimerase
VLFIGGTGSISGPCSHVAVSQGIDLWLVNRGNRQARLPKGIHFFQGDINNPSNELVNFLKESSWDCVVNWLVYTPEQAKRDIKLFAGKTKQYIFISSTSVYLNPSDYRRITEKYPVGNPIWPYAELKVRCEKIFLKGFKENRFPVTIVRPGHTYCDFTIPTNIIGLGYGLIERLLANKKIIVHDDGLSLWTLTHSEDFAEGLFGLLGINEAQGEIFHITQNRSNNWVYILETIGGYFNIDPNFIFIPSQAIIDIDGDIGASILGDKAKNLIFDNSKIKKFVPTYNPKITFEEGIVRSLKWHEENPELIYYNSEIQLKVDNIISCFLESF